MIRIIKLLFIAILFTGLGYVWCLYHAKNHYEPIIKDQKQTIKMLNRAYTRQFSKDFLEVKK